ncbi:MAG: RagB/SusD family nutrient uptake outer membrane protein [Bacteroides sp.]|nr:RagB/SusD family nutrient uptake outer membrane protein [Bacteroides sp.]
MKKINLIYTALGAALTLASCDDFLDTMPDNRAELNTEAKVASMLVSAYPNKSTVLMTEYGTDNVVDNGSQYTVYYRNQEETYLWKDITTETNDDPKYVWQSYYSAIASANQALEAIEDLGNPNSLASQKAEALMCRAYCHFALANVFCLPYNPETANKDMGIPYSEKPETQVVVNYERGTMAELYEKINNDIEAALPYISDEVYSVPKYHFNKKASYAFAARFNLFYVQPDKSNYQKVIDYATQVLGSNPTSVLRNYTALLPLGRADVGNAYVQAREPANLLLIPSYSTTGRLLSGMGVRYNSSKGVISNETYWATGPWGSYISGKDNYLIYSNKLYVNGAPNGVFPKLEEFWEATDKTGNSGFAHTVNVVFTTDETLLCRAEAYVFQEKYDEAAADLNTWQSSHCRSTLADRGPLQTLTRARINSFFGDLPYAVIPPWQKMKRIEVLRKHCIQKGSQ